jgi:hypothetical protein
MRDVRFNGNFTVLDNIFIKENHQTNFTNTPPNFKANATIEYNNIKINIILTKIEIQNTKTLFHFDKTHPHKFPQSINNCSIKFNWPFENNHPANLYTNVESGYSAKSFPSNYNSVYQYGPQRGRSQTTPMVAL